MATPLASQKRVKAISLALFLIGLAILSFLDAWWPGIMLVVGIPLALRQFLLGRHYDAAVSILVFGGVFITVQFDISWQILIPVFFTVGGIYVLFREYLESKNAPEEEKEQDINEEIEEEQEDKHNKH